MAGIGIPEVRVEVQRIEIEAGDVRLLEVHKHMPNCDKTLVCTVQVESLKLRELLEQLGQVARVPPRGGQTSFRGRHVPPAGGMCNLLLRVCLSCARHDYKTRKYDFEYFHVTFTCSLWVCLTLSIQ